MKRWARRLALSLGSTVAALAVAEAALWAADIEPARWAHPWRTESADKRAGVDAYPDDPRRYFDLDLRDRATRELWRGRGLRGLDAAARRTPHAVGFLYSRELCRAGVIPPRDPSRRRVVVIGDSFSEGQGVRTGDTFSSILDRRLGDAVEVINCGRRGYDFPAMHTWFDRHLALEPDVVLYAMVLNDPQQTDAFHARQAFLNDWILDRRRMYGRDQGPPFVRFRLLALAEDRVEGMRVASDTTRWYQDMVGPQNAAGWRATQEHIAAMGRAMTRRGGAFLVALWPLLVDLDSGYPFTSTHRTIGAALRRRGVPFVDTLDAFEGRSTEALWVHAADHHPNELAQRIFARKVLPALRRSLSDLPPR